MQSDFGTSGSGTEVEGAPGFSASLRLANHVTEVQE
jgi:hypothetical protein